MLSTWRWLILGWAFPPMTQTPTITKCSNERVPLVSSLQPFTKQSYSIPLHTTMLYFMPIIALWLWWLLCVPWLHILDAWLGGGELNVVRASSCRSLYGTGALSGPPIQQVCWCLLLCFDCSRGLTLTLLCVSCSVISSDSVQLKL
jgi:hypothetical protein